MTLKVSANIEQTLVDIPPEPIPVFKVTLAALKPEILQEALAGPTSSTLSRSVGIAPAYSSGQSGKLQRLTLVAGYRALVLDLGEPSERTLRGRQVLEDLFTSPDHVVLAFDMAEAAAALYMEQGIQFTNFVDVQDMLPSGGSRAPLEAVKFGVERDDRPIWEQNVQGAFRRPFIVTEKCATLNMVLRAWVADYIATLDTNEGYLYTCLFINSKNLADATISIAAQKALEMRRLEDQNPERTKHAAQVHYDTKRQKATIQSEVYQSRVRGSDMRVEMQAKTSLGHFKVSGITEKTTGRNTKVDIATQLDGMELSGVVSLGRADPTLADQQTSTYILHIMQNRVQLFTNPWAISIFGKLDNVVWPAPSKSYIFFPPPISMDPDRPLNLSQQAVVSTMLGSPYQDQMVLVQGPPGTGKTSVIATYVNSARAAGIKGIWLVAQSNIAVKNIAEKLLSTEFFSFRILVSKDFFEGWHEHVYHQIRRFMITSDEFRSPKDIAYKLQDTQVILCTISMLSHPKISFFTRPVPFNILIIDEASQISTREYLAMLNKQHSSLKRMVFIGDDQQLPPFGDKETQSIFEISHLRPTALLLNIQYRMPPQLGDFISQAMYNDQLNSNPLHPITQPACFFVDVANGKAIQRGTSFINREECTVILKIASKFEEEGRSFRIITPYDAQRNTIEEALKEQGLNWADKVHNVDSFQGNEDNFILISVVRHQGLGFLEDRRRTNVMLTRCKRGMFICTSKQFMARDGKDSLVGQLAQACKEEAWLTVKDIEMGKF